MSPLVGCSRPRISRASVVFPEPGLANDRKDLGRIGRQGKIGIDDCIDIATRELAAHYKALGDVRDLEQRGHHATSLLEPDPAKRTHVGAAPARDAVVQPDHLEWWHVGLALLDGERATRVKAAAGGRFGKIGRSSEARLSEAGLETTGIGDTICCYAEKTETWLAGPDGTRWE